MKRSGGLVGGRRAQEGEGSGLRGGTWGEREKMMAVKE